MIIDSDTLTQYVGAAIGVHATAVAVVNLTPTPRDNEALGNGARMVVQVYRAIEILAGIFTPLVKK